MEDIQVEQYEILGIEKIPTGTANEVLELALYLFDYRLAVNDAEVQMPEDGITGQFWLSRSGTSPVNYPLNLIAEENWLLPDQQTYLLLKRYVSDGTWTPMYVLTEEEIQELYATETMLAEYGDAYTAAAMELWLGG